MTGGSDDDKREPASKVHQLCIPDLFVQMLTCVLCPSAGDTVNAFKNNTRFLPGVPENGIISSHTWL